MLPIKSRKLGTQTDGRTEKPYRYEDGQQKFLLEYLLKEEQKQEDGQYKMVSKPCKRKQVPRLSSEALVTTLLNWPSIYVVFRS